MAAARAPTIVTTAVSSPIVSLGPLEVSEIPNFQSSFRLFSIQLGLYNGSGQKRFSTSHTQTLVRFPFSASLCFVGPARTVTSGCSVQPCHGRTPRPFRCHG